MDEVGGVFGEPDVGFPTDLVEVIEHDLACGEGGDEDETGGAAFEEFLEFAFALVVDGAVTGDGLDEDEPVAVFEVDDDIGHFSVGVEMDAEFLEIGDFLFGDLFTGIADVADVTARGVAGAELLDDDFDENVLSSC